MLQKKKKYFANLNVKTTTENKNIWQTIKLFLSEKTKSREKNTLIENEKLVSGNKEAAKCLNNFFSDIVKNRETPMYEVKDNFHQNIESPTLKAVLKYRNHPSIISISHSFHQTSSFNFSCIDKNSFKKNSALKRDSGLTRHWYTSENGA